MLRGTLSVVIVYLAGVTQGVIAQDAGKIELGAFDLTPRVSADFSYIDNVIYSSDSGDQIESWRTVFAPGLLMSTEIGANKLQLDYHLSRGTFFSSQADNYTDNFVTLLSEYEINSRHRLKGEYRFEDSHDDRGRRFSNGSGSELGSPDTFKSNRLIGVYSFGSSESAANVDVNLDYMNLDYDIDEGDYVYRDRVATELSAQLYYRLSTRSRFVIDLGRTDVNYDLARSTARSLDSVRTKMLAGFTWGSTPASTSYVKVGYETKEFDSPDREDFEGLDWEVGLRWHPLSYSTVEITTLSDTRETNGESDFIDSQEYGVRWDHAWLQRLSTYLDLRYVENVYVGDLEIEDDRRDKMSNLRMGVSYDFRRWLNLGVYYHLSSRSSNRESVEFDRNIFGITAKVTL
ncbi:outer membrane beta-barrel protein [Alteromonas aestuariivivens]|nr:outer membrane beta-barrel protein [Alteromonas aestuariivivens]